MVVGDNAGVGSAASHLRRTLHDLGDGLLYGLGRGPMQLVLGVGSRARGGDHGHRPRCRQR